MSYAGLDLSRQRLDVHVMDDQGSTVEVTAVHPDTDALRSLTAVMARHGENGGIRLDMDAASTADGETYVYGLEPGRYQYGVDYAWCQFSVAEPVSWVIDIERLDEE